MYKNIYRRPTKNEVLKFYYTSLVQQNDSSTGRWEVGTLISKKSFIVYGNVFLDVRVKVETTPKGPTEFYMSHMRLAIMLVVTFAARLP